MSTVKANDLTNVTGGIPTVKSQQLIPTAWVNFNGQNTVAIRDSENVSSITDSGVGQYYVNFGTATANANYAMLHGRDGNSDSSNTFTTQYYFNGADLASTSKFPVCTKFNGAVHDSGNISVLVMGGQA